MRARIMHAVCMCQNAVGEVRDSIAALQTNERMHEYMEHYK